MVDSSPFRRLAPLMSLLLVPGLVVMVHADPLNRRQLPANAIWFIHLDVDAARSSTLGQGFRDVWVKQPEVAKGLAIAQAATGIDPTREIQSLTVYGLAFSPDETVVIVHGKFDRPRLETLVKGWPDYHRDIANGHEIFIWTERKPEAENGKCTRAGAFFAQDTILISPSPAALATALDVLEGKSASLPDKSPLAVSVPEGTIVLAAVSGLAQAKALPIQSPILRKCDSGWVTVGEHDGVAALHGRVLTDLPETAEQLRDLVMGGRSAAILLQDPKSPFLKRLFKPLTATSEGNALDVRWEFSSAELVKIIQETLAARKPVVAQQGKDK